MPRYVRVLGYVADGLEYSEEADAIDRFFLEQGDDSDTSLPERVKALLEPMPAVRVWVLTEPEEDDEATLALHICRSSRRSMVSLDARVIRAAHRKPPASGWGRIGPSEIAAAILGDSEPLPAGLAHREDWLERLTGGSTASRELAIAAATRIATSLAKDDETRSRRKALVLPLVEALTQVPDEDPLRRRLWDIACWLNADAICEASLDAFQRGDPALEDAHVERQRKLVFEVLPRAVAKAGEETPDADWLPRARALLERYELGR